MPSHSKEVGWMIDVGAATKNDLLYIDDLQKKNAEQLAFYPKIVFEREVGNCRILLAKINDTPAGYLYHGAFGKTLKIHQACIQYDVRGFLYGAELIRFLNRLAKNMGCLSITLRCGSDLDANKFWQAMGFYCESITAGGVRRMRDINCWRLDLQPILFTTKTNPSLKKTDASVWRKGRKKSGGKLDGGKGFLRGKKMQMYRTAIIKGASDE